MGILTLRLVGNSIGRVAFGGDTADWHEGMKTAYVNTPG